ncbi:MAG: class I SAM-dependent methyltransferase [Deltaproteobacteria bacterium]|nr:class I SAM-dependent methyltransferase [Deltaproteobacteria bacterium]
MRDYEKAVADCYSTWGKTYYDEYYGEKAPYPQVHTELLRSLLKAVGAKNLLDAGCGPASFLRDILNEGIDLYGFDLTPEMVEEAKRIFSENDLPENNIWHGSVLDKEAFALPGKDLGAFDAVICSGVMPHISEEDEDHVICNLKSAVKPGGLVALEARNQFFSLFSLNRYSYDFFRNELIRADELLQQGREYNNEITESLEAMKEQFRMDFPPVRKGKESEPGYDEVLSRVHNPLILKEKFEQMGFTEVNLKFYHFHPLPPVFSKQLPDFFVKQGVTMENPDDWRGFFMASAFFVIGKG